MLDSNYPTQGPATKHPHGDDTAASTVTNAFPSHLIGWHGFPVLGTHDGPEGFTITVGGPASETHTHPDGDDIARSKALYQHCGGRSLGRIDLRNAGPGGLTITIGEDAAGHMMMEGDNFIPAPTQQKFDPRTMNAEAHQNLLADVRSSKSKVEAARAAGQDWAGLTYTLSPNYDHPVTPTDPDGTTISITLTGTVLTSAISGDRTFDIYDWGFAERRPASHVERTHSDDGDGTTISTTAGNPLAERKFGVQDQLVPREAPQIDPREKTVMVPALVSGPLGLTFLVFFFWYCSQWVRNRRNRFRAQDYGRPQQVQQEGEGSELENRQPADGQREDNTQGPAEGRETINSRSAEGQRTAVRKSAERVNVEDA